MGWGISPTCISAPLRQIPSDLVYKHQNTGIVYKPIRNQLVPKASDVENLQNVGTWVGKVVTIVVLVFAFAHILMLDEYNY